MKFLKRDYVAFGILAIILSFTIFLYLNADAFDYSYTRDLAGNIHQNDPQIKNDSPLVFWIASNQVFIFCILLITSAFIIDWKKIAILLNKLNNNNDGV